MIDELDGGEKAQESVIGLLRARKYLQRRFGSVHVSFGEPISLDAALGNQRERFAALQRGQIDSLQEREKLEIQKREFVADLGNSLVERIGWAAVANSTSVAAASLLGAPHVGMLRQTLTDRMTGVAGLLELQGVRLTPTFEKDLDGQLVESLNFLERSDLIRIRSDQRGDILYFEESRRRALDIYRNSIAHFLVVPSIVARSVLGRRRQDEMAGDLEAWIDVFYREFYTSRDLLLSRGEAVAEYFQERDWMRAQGDRWAPQARGLDILTVLSEQTRGVIEYYDTVTRVLLRNEGQGLRSALLKESQDASENARLLGTARRPESVSETSFDNVVSWLSDLEIIESERVTGKRNARDTRYARGGNWGEIDRIRALLASALTDR